MWATMGAQNWNVFFFLILILLKKFLSGRKIMFLSNVSCLFWGQVSVRSKKVLDLELEQRCRFSNPQSFKNIFWKDRPSLKTIFCSPQFYSIFLFLWAVNVRSKKVLDLEAVGCRLAKTSHQNFEKEYPFFLLQKYCTWNMGQWAGEARRY